MVRIKIEVEENGTMSQRDWVEVTEEDYARFEKELLGWNTANFLVNVAGRYVVQGLPLELENWVKDNAE